MSCAAASTSRARRVTAIDEAQDMFQHAIDLDPSYAAAYAALGLSLIEAVASGWTEFIADDLGRAETLAQKALSLDSSLDHRLIACSRRSTYERGALISPLRTDRPCPRDQSERCRELCRSGRNFCWAGRAAEALPWLEARFASIPPMLERPFILVWPIISLTGTARPSKRWTALSPVISDVSPSSWDGLFWRPPTHSWIDDRTPSESGPR